MMSDLMREEFERWFRSVWPETEMNGAAGHSFKNSLAAAWQASRECLVIELPEPIELEVVGVGCTFHSECLHGHAVVDAIHAAGVKTK